MEKRTAGQGIAQEDTQLGGPSIGRLPEYDTDSLRINPADPHHPWDFSVVDFPHLAEAARRAQEATYDWVAAEEPVRERVWRTAPLTERRTSIETRWEGACRPFSGALGAYVRNVMDLPDGTAWPVLFDQAQDRVLKEGLRKVRQDVYA